MTKSVLDRSGEVLLSRDQLAERWGCCKETIKRMQQKGELLAIVFSGKNIRYSLADIEQLERERKHRKYAMVGEKSHAYLHLLKTDLVESAQEFCKYLFPSGYCKHGEYSIGSLHGEPGSSLKIRLVRPKAGMWKDFAAGESGNNLLDLLCKVRNCHFRVACEEASGWLHVPDTPERHHDISCPSNTS
jgi:hypothetical protein